MTIELKFSGLSPELALKLLQTAAGTSAEPQAQPTATTVHINPEELATAVAPAIPAAPSAPVQQAVPPVQTMPAVPVAQNTAAPAPVTPAPPLAPAPAAPVPTAPPTSVKQYTADELAVAARPICEMPGGREKLLDLLHSFTYTDSTGAVRTVQSIMEMPQELYPALANGIRQLGGRI